MCATRAGAAIRGSAMAYGGVRWWWSSQNSRQTCRNTRHSLAHSLSLSLSLSLGSCLELFRHKSHSTMIDMETASRLWSSTHHRDNGNHGQFIKTGVPVGGATGNGMGRTYLGLILELLQNVQIVLQKAAALWNSEGNVFAHQEA